VLLAVEGVRRMKLVMYRSLGSYRDVSAKAQALLERAGFWGKREVEVRNLSHGEQRQVEILLALASDPKLLLLDEPSAGLATGESQEMATFLKALDPEIAILLIEHDMDVAFQVAQALTVLHYGEVLADGSAQEIRANRQVQEIYLGVE
jgi:branched-chain amino acid transport system ATP-binding protein